MKAVVPCFVSTRGYGVLFDCGSLMTFRDDESGTCWCADAVDELDYYVFQGNDLDALYGRYFQLTGPAPMLPQWAFGYMQSKERYVNAEEIVAVAREYRRRKIPLDCIVLDWKSWPNGAGWGQKSFDVDRFPSPSAMTDELHAMGVKLMVSIWPVMTGGCADQVELETKRQMLGNRSTYDAFDAAARATYWSQARRGLFEHGVDAWWCDCTEPFEADWVGEEKPDAQTRLAINKEAAKKYIDEAKISLYSLYHSQGIYEGQRASGSGKRVVNLTRSSYAGQHRYGTITWNGDICATWETLRRCIPEGLNFCAAGEPYWTVDIGGFFIDNHEDLWFWKGDYRDGCRGLTPADALVPDVADTGCRDLGFWELYTRWLQYATFLPMMRSHGTDAPREIWRFGDAGGPFYDAIAKFIRLRYCLLPYLYSLAAQVTLAGSPMLRAMGLQYPDDVRAHAVDDQFFLGGSMMVCPVTLPMYYARDSRALKNVSCTRSVYLPVGDGWYDFWTEKLEEGGASIEVGAPLETIPVFVRMGSILPLASAMQHTGEMAEARYTINIYTGADARFVLYEDAGDGYEYEGGAFALVAMEWHETEREMRLGTRQGGFEGMVAVRELELRFIGKEGVVSQQVRYDGVALRVTAEGLR
jgi:alpha-D-xyloside xylohydrolase